MRALACLALIAGSLYSHAFNLSNDVIPRKETVQLTIDPARETFEGSVSIDVDLRGLDSTIWLNAKNLTYRIGIPCSGRRPRYIRPRSFEDLMSESESKSEIRRVG